MPQKRKLKKEDEKKKSPPVAGAKGASKLPPKDFEFSMEVIKVGDTYVDNTPKMLPDLTPKPPEASETDRGFEDSTHFLIENPKTLALKGKKVSHHPLEPLASIEEERPVKEKPRELKSTASALTPPSSRKSYHPESELEQSMYFQGAEPTIKPGKRKELTTMKKGAGVTSPEELPFPQMRIGEHEASLEASMLGDDWAFIDDSASIPSFVPPTKAKSTKKAATKKGSAKALTDADLFNTFFEVPRQKDATYRSYLKVVQKEFDEVRRKGYKKGASDHLKNLSWCINRIKSSAEHRLISEIEHARTGDQIDMKWVMNKARAALKKDIPQYKNPLLTEEYCEGALHLSFQEVSAREELRKALIQFDSPMVSEYLELFNPETMDSDFLQIYGNGLFKPNQYHRGSTYYDIDVLKQALKKARELYTNFKSRNYPVDFRTISNDDVTKMMMELRRWVEQEYTSEFDSYTYKGIMMRAIAALDGFVS
ncbi:hypothetical protein [Aureibacter tunicatorum]|uniref:Uncharacterized protein n=1 Tax=Aureibacter tunicatorum TaxID=866807 RepID=A0AAE3XQQ1_9BACT|nr:hypothetical protein [Aureibacter tunicatorum]MDR6241382.1 hypothetical protein [Aureibacter tunicatorum]BDD06773.1 hypothetical protein AUTU_42560 [Aureibacter tunicatorum]